MFPRSARLHVGLSRAQLAPVWAFYLIAHHVSYSYARDAREGHREWPFGAQAPAPDDCAANDVAPGAGAVFAKPILNESALP
jgi:hypothetical protein